MFSQAQLRDGALTRKGHWLAILAFAPGTIAFALGFFLLFLGGMSKLLDENWPLSDAILRVVLSIGSLGLAGLCGPQLLMLLFRIEQIEFRDDSCIVNYAVHATSRIVKPRRCRHLFSWKIFDWIRGRRRCAVFVCRGLPIVIADGMEEFDEVVRLLRTS
jgi:hypothetical protein